MNDWCELRSRPAKDPAVAKCFHDELEACRRSSLTLSQFIFHAAIEWRSRKDDGSSEYRSSLWDFTRLLRGHPELRDRTAKDAWRQVDAIVNAWGGGRVGWSWFGLTRVDAECEFLSVWDAVRKPEAVDPVAHALRLAQTRPLVLRKAIADARPEQYPVFVSLAGWLQVVHPERPILLPVRKIGETLGCSPMTVSRYTAWAEEDGYIVRTKAPKFNRRTGTGSAAEFKFVTERFAGLSMKGSGAVHEVAASTNTQRPGHGSEAPPEEFARSWLAEHYPDSSRLSSRKLVARFADLLRRFGRDEACRAVLQAAANPNVGEPVSYAAEKLVRDADRRELASQPPAQVPVGRTHS
ncbi:MAG: hypothetical protein ACM359_15585 [Bacillota bacterium]